MGKGYLVVETTTAGQAAPVSGAKVRILSDSGSTIEEMYTNENGYTKTIGIEAPDIYHTLDPNDEGPYFSSVDAEITAEGYTPVIVRNIKIFDTETAMLPVNMIPHGKADPNILSSVFPAEKNNGAGGAGNAGNAAIDQETAPIEIYIPNNDLHSDEPRIQENGYTTPRQERVLKEVVIPSTIIVHLGSPNNTAARNVYVPFTDYIKNVASNEIFSTWPTAALESNILAQISFALNRIYTEWYPSQGKNFNITNSTAFDQNYVYGGAVYKSISNVVDRVFNMFIRRQGYKEPFFAQFCNGTTVTCAGLSQWGSKSYADQGLSPINILKKYYPADIQIEVTNNIGTVGESYPGFALREGSKGNDVKTMQNYLNRIGTNYPRIPPIPNPNGTFDGATTAAVKEFQKWAGLTADGIIGKATWNKISYIYVGIRKLAELTSEGERFDIGQNPPVSVIREGSRGNDVVELQFILDYLSLFIPTIPDVIQNGIFDSQTTQAVKAFQQTYNLTADGIVGPATWRKLYEVYRDIKSGGGDGGAPETGEKYPGTVLKLGSKGDSVLLMQKYLNSISNYYNTIPRVAEDGIFGNGTRNAVVAFQNLFGLTPDGMIGPATWNKIVEIYNMGSKAVVPYPGYLLRQGSTGDHVRVLQKYLNAIRQTNTTIPPLNEDGIFGGGTKTAVTTYQRLFGLTADGIVGPATWNSIANTFAGLQSRSMIQGMAAATTLLRRMLTGYR